MRTSFLAGLASLSLAAAPAGAAVADTVRAPLPQLAQPGAPAPWSDPLAGGAPAAAAVALSLGGGAGAASFAQDGESYQDARVQVWMDDGDLLRVGDRPRVMVRSTEDAYLAVIHIDTNGDVEFLYPTSPNDDGYVRGGRTFTVPSRNGGRLAIRGGYGIGYVFAVASDAPLDYARYRHQWYRSASWGRDTHVFGDPFVAMERFERGLVTDDYAGYDTDYYTYHVGRRYTYPRYACYDDYGPWYYSRSTYWGSCDRVRVLLVRTPYYYDTRYYRRTRRVYVDRSRYPVRRSEPEHAYKDRTGSAGTPPLRRAGSRGAEGTTGVPAGRVTDGVSAPGGRRPRPAADAPPAARPSTEERQQQPARGEPAERTRPVFGRRSSEPREEPRRAEPRAEPRSAPRAEPRSEPRREEPRRAEPQRRSEPRSEPRVERRSEPRRESSPPRASSGGSRSSGGSSGRSSAPRSRNPDR